MEEELDKYKPINCDFHDHFEIHAVRGTWLKIHANHPSGKQEIISKIKTLLTRDGEEYAVLLDQRHLRLDYVVKLEPLDPDSDLLGHLLDKLDYNNWANKRFFDLFEAQNLLPEVVKTMSHILNAHDIWNKRMLPSGDHFDVWQNHQFETWNTLNQKLFLETLNILNIYEPSHILNYKNLAGNPFRSSISGIISHMVNHATYHRGQIITFLQESKLKTISTDYILFCRRNLI